MRRRDCRCLVRHGAAEERQERVPQLPSIVNIGGSEREPQSLLGEVGQVDREMAPEGAVIVPEVMVRVAWQATDGQFRDLVHAMCAVVGAHTPGGRLKTKTPSERIATASGFQGEYFDSGAPKGSRASAGDSAPARAPLPSRRGQEAGLQAEA